MVKSGDTVHVYEDDNIRISGPQSSLDTIVDWFNAWDFGGKFELGAITFYGTGLFAEVKGVPNVPVDTFIDLQKEAINALSEGYYIPRFVIVGEKPMPIFYLPEGHNLRGELLEQGVLDDNNLKYLEILPLLMTVAALYEPKDVRQLFCGIDLNRAWNNCYYMLQRQKSGEDTDPLSFAKNGWAFISAAVYLESIDCGSPLTERLTTIGKVAVKPGTSLHASSEPMSQLFKDYFVNAPMLYPPPVSGLDKSLVRFGSKLGPFLKATFFPPAEKNIPEDYLNDFIENLEVCLEFPLHY